MPITAPYDYDRVERWARRVLSHLEREGQATDDELIQSVDLGQISEDCETYDPRDYRRQASVELEGRGSTETAHELADEKQESDKRALFYYHRGPVLATHEDVLWRAEWRVDPEELPGVDAVRDLTESFDVSGFPQKVILDMVAELRDTTESQERGPSTYELLSARQVPDVDQETLDEAARFLAEEVPGVDPPRTDEYISWVESDEASWVYLPAVDDVETQEVADAGV